MYYAHGTYPWSDWNGIWTYHTKFIPSGAARLLIEQAIACTERGGPADLLPLGQEFENAGLLNKAFRVVRVYLKSLGPGKEDQPTVVAVYNHDGIYNLIEAEEKAFIDIWTTKSKMIAPSMTWLLYPDEYTIESVMRR